MIYTGYFSNIQKYLNNINDLTLIGIAGKLPSFLNSNNIIHMKELAPSWSIFSEYKKDNNEQRYAERFYLEILSQKNPMEILTKINSCGSNSILLCYESPSNFCHRHLVAEWLNRLCKTTIIELII